MATRFSLRRVAAGERTFGDEVRQGLTAVQKSLPPRYFYDDLGSALFDAICNLPEYYPTRAEEEVLQRNGGAIARAAGDVNRIVEFGSGSGRKTRLLLDQYKKSLEYVPIDIDPQSLEKAGRELLSEYPSLQVNAICSDFSRPSRVLATTSGGGPTLVIFLGSTIGNFHPRDAVGLLADARRVLHTGDSFLLGADLRKSKDVLDAAYNDALGVTAAFNLNLLQRMNRELGAHFDLRSFAHRAFYDEKLGRIEMHLVSLREQQVRIDALNLEVSFTEGETIHSENSYKYDERTLEQMATDSGFEIAGKWTDSGGRFADVLMRPR